jgi:serine/threonine protein kinase
LHFTRFGKYEIIRKLGRSLTDVYLALDPETNRRVVLKIVEECRDPLTQLIVEAERRGAAIQHQLHELDPRILEVYEYGDRDGCFFLAMQYAEGRSLAELIRKEGRLDADRAARYGAEICSQLQTLHSFQADIDGHRRAVVHGDIKPANIQIGPNEEVWLLDFGIAKAITATRNLTQHNLGSPAYCSPERLKNGNVDPFADLWAVGVCLYEMVSGLPPYQAQTTRKLENLIQSRRPPRAVPDTCPHALRSIIWKAMAADSARRYPSAAALEQDLRCYLDRKPISAASEREPAWDANATLQKEGRNGTPAQARPLNRRRLSRFLAEFNVVAWSLIAGLVIGLLCFIPASHAYRYWRDSAPLRASHDYAAASVSDIDKDWRLYSSLQHSYAWLGDYSPAGRLSEPMLRRLVAAGDQIVDAYRNSGAFDVAKFDWDKARACFRHASAIQPSNSELNGKIALCDGYLQLAHSPLETGPALRSFEQSIPLLPKAPDPHLALAHIYLYDQHNLGLASAQLHAAETLGYKPGPRESELQADGYLYRAEQEFRRWQQAKTASDLRRWDTLMQRDFDRARQLYEPIAGFSNVSRSLERIESDQTAAEQIRQARAAREARERAKLEAARRRARYRRWR